MIRRDFLKGLLATGVVTLVQPTLPLLPSPIKPVVIDFDELARITLARYRPLFASMLTRDIEVARYFRQSFK